MKTPVQSLLTLDTHSMTPTHSFILQSAGHYHPNCKHEEKLNTSSEVIE